MAWQSIMAIGTLPEKFLRDCARQLGISYRMMLVIVAILVIALLVFIYFMVKG